MSQTAVIRLEKFEQAPIYISRAAAVALILAAFLGTYVAFNGGWERFWVFDNRSALAVLLSLLYFSMFSALQWGSKARGGNWIFVYVASIIFSVVPSFLTYGYFLIDLIDDVLPSFAAYIVTIIVLAFGDMLPEWILFD